MTRRVKMLRPYFGGERPLPSLAEATDRRAVRFLLHGRATARRVAARRVRPRVRGSGAGANGWEYDIRCEKLVTLLDGLNDGTRRAAHRVQEMSRAGHRAGRTRDRDPIDAPGRDGRIAVAILVSNVDVVPREEPLHPTRKVDRAPADRNRMRRAIATRKLREHKTVVGVATRAVDEKIPVRVVAVGVVVVQIGIRVRCGRAGSSRIH